MSNFYKTRNIEIIKIIQNLDIKKISQIEEMILKTKKKRWSRNNLWKWRKFSNSFSCGGRSIPKWKYKNDKFQ